jgi:hypothetical protein
MRRYSRRSRRSGVGRTIIALVLLQLFEPAPYDYLPGVNPRPVGPKLYFCVVGEDWWAFLYNMLDGSCPIHGTRATRTPAVGSSVSGPCQECGQRMELTAYDPRTHGPSDLVHPACRLTNGGQHA